MRAWVVVVLWLAACGDDGTGTPGSDAGTPDAGEAMPGAEELPSGALLQPPEAPAPAALPELACPDGWRTSPPTHEGGAAVCDPWPEDGRARCAVHEAHLPGEPGCARVGTECPRGAGGFPADVPMDRPVLYVSGFAGSGGDGTLVAPFATVNEALAVASATTVVAVGIGDYEEAVDVPDAVTLMGACPERTRVTWSTRDAAPATVRIVGDGAHVTNLGIAGARSGLLVERDAMDAIVDRVIIDTATETGLRVHHGGTATVTDVAIRNTQTDPGDGFSAYALVVELEGVADVSRAALEQSGNHGSIVDSPLSVLRLSDSVVAQTRPAPDGSFGVGLLAQRSGRIELMRSAVENNFSAGVSASTDGTLSLADCVVRDTVPQMSTSTGGVGLLNQGGGLIEASRTLVERNAFVQITMSPGPLSLSDVVVRDGVHGGEGFRASGIGTGGVGDLMARRVSIEGHDQVGLTVGPDIPTDVEDLTIVDVWNGILLVDEPAASFERVRVERPTSAGLIVSRESTRASIRDLVVQDARPAAGRSDVVAIYVWDQAELTLERALLEDMVGGALVLNPAGIARVSDLTIRGTAAAVAGDALGIGWSVYVNAGSDLTAERLFVDRATALAMAFAVSTVSATDLRVRDTRSLDGRDLSVFFGRGLDMQQGAQVRLERAIFEGNRNSDIFAHDVDSRLELVDVILRNTHSDERTRTGGHGLYTGAPVTGRWVRLENNREVGMAAAFAGSIVLSDVEIFDVGANECAVDTCASEPGGIGVAAYGGGYVELTDFAIGRTALAGAVVGEDGEMDLHRGEVFGNPIGANVQNPSLDIARLTDEVVYRDNDINLDATMLPIPEAPGEVTAPPPDPPAM